MTPPAAGAERHLLNPTTRSDVEALEALLHHDFVEVGRGGTVWSRADIIAELLAAPDVHGEPEDLHVDELAYGNALVTYSLDGVRRSSIWIREGGRWQLRYHQATPVSENR